MSIHTETAREVARRKGGSAGSESARPLWDWSKRELIECLLHLAAQATDNYDEAIADGALRAVERVREEYAALKSQGLV